MKVGERKLIHGQWSSRWTFILAATGSAVGLGNIWKFPYMVGENGGGAFVLVYLICVALVGIPIMISEIMLGRRGRRNPIDTMRDLAASEGANRNWRWLGFIGLLAGFLILSYYSVIAGWTLAYIFRTGTGVFFDADPSFSKRIFSELVSDPERLLAWHTLFTAMTVIIVSRGVKGGLEKAAQFLMPALFLLLLVMVFYAMTTDKFIEAMRYLFVTDFGKIIDQGLLGSVLLSALGQAFFSLSLGMGAIMIYGSYLSQQTSIPTTAVYIAAADTLVAILAGMAIFPIVFTYGLEPTSGPSLIFISLPIAFGQMPLGSFFGTLFFFLLMLAAWTSSISLLEPAVAWLIENKNMSRVRASMLAGTVSWSLGLLTILSFSHWAFEFTFAGKQRGNGIFDILDILTADVMLPLGGLLIAIFSAWIMKSSTAAEELGVGSGLVYRGWRIAARYIAPIGVVIIALNAIGVFKLLH